MSYTAAQLIELLHLLPHPEGGWYAFRESSGQVLPALPGFPGHLESCSYIYYLLQRGEISRWHQLKATEVWTWHQGGMIISAVHHESGEERLHCLMVDDRIPAGAKLY